MDSQTVTILSEIKYLQIAILSIVTLLALIKILEVASRIVSNWTVNREKAFIHLASDLYDKEEYDELIDYCEDRASKWKNNPYPLYWLARAKYRKGDLHGSKELFERVEATEPEWQSSVQPHLQKINAKLLQD